MTDRPIIFSAPMVRALLDGRKTMTRRKAWKKEGERGFVQWGEGPSPWQRVQPGDRLWVREAWRTDARCDEERPLSIGAVEYEASPRQYPEMPLGRLRPSIHMPRWASRLTLTVTAVRVERLQEISEADARAEGMTDFSDDEMKRVGIDGFVVSASARRSFWLLWDHLHGPSAWDANPEVVALSFTVARRNIDQPGD